MPNFFVLHSATDLISDIINHSDCDYTKHQSLTLIGKLFIHYINTDQIKLLKDL